MHEQGGHLEAVDEPGPGFAPALEREGNHAAAPVGQVFGGPLLVRVTLQRGVAYGLDLVVLLEPVGDGIGILAMALNAQGQGFKPLIDQKGPERRLDRQPISRMICVRALTI